MSFAPPTLPAIDTYFVYLFCQNYQNSWKSCALQVAWTDFTIMLKDSLNSASESYKSCLPVLIPIHQLVFRPMWAKMSVKKRMFR